MIMCNKCGEIGLLESDLLGSDGCIYCCNNALTISDTCTTCGVSLEGKSIYISSNGDECFNCHNK